ncbi:MAG TPA: hypothetical protein VH184_05440 [Dongiaceae bacterium]|nr:hypothetical protein [Dongiaceae bacterium]
MISRLADALDRIEAAVSRLEGVAVGRARAVDADHGRMTSELRDLRGKNAALQAEARNVAARLDSVIERLKVVAES